MTYRQSIMAMCYRAFNSAPLSPGYNRDEDDSCLGCGEIPMLGLNDDGLCRECQDKIDDDNSIQFINPIF